MGLRRRPTGANAGSLSPSHIDRTRIDAVDGLRGLAVVLMIIYHFSWDLTWFGLVDWPLLTDPVWLAFRTLIVSLFLGLVGINLVLATTVGVQLRPFLRRLAAIAGAAALISAATILAIPDTFIFFGVLHHIAVASVLALPFLRLPAATALVTAAACIVAPIWLAAPIFDAPALRWLGLMTYAPQSNDYVPILPWFAAVLTGLAAARFGLQCPSLAASVRRWQAPRPVLTPVLWLGRHSLAVYLLHQPVLIGALLAFLAVTNPGALRPLGVFQDGGARFIGECAAACRARAGDAACRRYCACVHDHLSQAGLTGIPRTDAASLDATTRSILFDSVQACLDPDDRPLPATPRQE